MAKRRSSPIRVTGPRVRVTSRGVKITKPRARIGGKAGVNVSSSGVSASVRTKAGTLSTKRGLTLRGVSLRRKRIPGCPLAALILAAIFAITLAAGPRSTCRHLIHWGPRATFRQWRLARRLSRPRTPRIIE